MSGKKQPREQVVERFENGRKFTEELLEEYETLRRAIAKLQADKRELERSMSHTEVGTLKKKVEVLEAELAVQVEQNRALLEQFETLDGDNHHFADRYADVFEFVLKNKK